MSYKLHVHTVFGLNQPASGKGLGLREFGEHLHTNFPLTIGFSGWEDNLIGDILKLRTTENLVLIGHSFGGGRIVDSLSNICKIGIVRAVFLLDPVPIETGWGFMDNKHFVIPDCANECVCWMRGFWNTPWFIVWSKKIKNPSARFVNIKINKGHNDMPSCSEIQDVIYGKIDRLCRVL